jgi:hypothetical protein
MLAACQGRGQLSDAPGRKNVQCTEPAKNQQRAAIEP